MLLKILCDKDTYMLSEHVGVAEQTLKINGHILLSHHLHWFVYIIMSDRDP